MVQKEKVGLDLGPDQVQRIGLAERWPVVGMGVPDVVDLAREQVRQVDELLPRQRQSGRSNARFSRAVPGPRATCASWWVSKSFQSLLGVWVGASALVRAVSILRDKCK